MGCVVDKIIKIDRKWKIIKIGRKWKWDVKNGFKFGLKRFR